MLKKLMNSAVLLAPRLAVRGLGVPLDVVNLLASDDVAIATDRANGLELKLATVLVLVELARGEPRAEKLPCALG